MPQYEGPYAAFYMINNADNYCVDCTCDNQPCHCDSDGCDSCSCGECKCKNMYKGDGWGEPTVEME